MHRVDTEIMFVYTPLAEPVRRPFTTLDEAKPFLKWAGGKQQLLTQFDSLFPSHIDRYFEPFLGGGAVFFHLWNKHKIAKQTMLFDNNVELIITYKAVRDQVDDLIQQLRLHERLHNRAYYYHIRSMDRAENIQLNDVERAARMLYLNRTCYNGLYRVNRKDQFNVPMGSYVEPKILHDATLRSANVALQNTCLQVQDFRIMADIAQAGDFIYFDPPYNPISKTASFTNYTAGDFGDNDQRALAALFKKLATKNCYCMLSNSYTPFILDLYQGFRIEAVLANRAINSNGKSRGGIKEVVILNY